MTTAPPCDLSVVVPAYQEAGTIRHPLTTIARYLDTLPWSWEILVVNDGSQDATAAEAEAGAAVLGPQHIRVLHHPHNLGKGAAVRTGVLASAGERILFCDADGATPIEELRKFLPALEHGADLVVGSRRIAGAQIQRHQQRLRQFCGRIYTHLTNCLLTSNVSDITCGFKLFRRPAAQEIFRRGRVTGWSFDAELFYLAHALGYRVVEVPVTWAHQPNTKVRVLRDAVTSFLELLRIRWRALCGQYR